MIIRIIATALIQCTIRTHAGWMTFAVTAGGLALAARLDIAIPSLKIVPTHTIRREPGLRYRNARYRIGAQQARRSQKGEPGCPGSLCACATVSIKHMALRRHQDGIDHVDHAVRLVA